MDPTKNSLSNISALARLPPPDISNLKTRCAGGITPLSVPHFTTWAKQSGVSNLPILEVRRWKHQKSTDWWHEFLVVKLAPVPELASYAATPIQLNGVPAKPTKPGSISDAELAGLVAKGLTFRIDRGRRMRSGPSSTPQQPKPKSKSGPKGKGKAAVAESDSELSDVASDDPRAAPIGGRSHQQVLDLIEIMRPGAEESFASRKVFVVERISSVTSAELADIPPAFLPKLYDLSFLLGRYIAVDPNYDLFGHNCWSMAASISYLLRSYFKYYWRRELIEIPLEARPHNLVKQLQDILSSAFGNAKSAEVCYKIELVLGERGTLFRPDRMTLDVHPARGLYHQAKIYSGNLDVEGAAKMLYPLTRQLGWMLDLARFGIDEMLAQFLQIAVPPPIASKKGSSKSPSGEKTVLGIPPDSPLGIVFGIVESLSRVGAPGFPSLRDTSIIEPLVEFGTRNTNTPLLVQHVIRSLTLVTSNPAGAPHAQGVERAVQSGAVDMVLTTITIMLNDNTLPRNIFEFLNFFLMLSSRRVTDIALLQSEHKNVFARLILDRDIKELVKGAALHTLGMSLEANEDVQNMMREQTNDFLGIIQLIDDEVLASSSEECAELRDRVCAFLGCIAGGSQRSKEALLEVGYTELCLKLLRSGNGDVESLLRSFRNFSDKPSGTTSRPTPHLVAAIEECDFVSEILGDSTIWAFDDAHSEKLELIQQFFLWISELSSGSRLLVRSEYLAQTTKSIPEMPMGLLAGMSSTICNIAHFVPLEADVTMGVLEILHIGRERVLKLKDNNKINGTQDQKIIKTLVNILQHPGCTEMARSHTKDLVLASSIFQDLSRSSSDVLKPLNISLDAIRCTPDDLILAPGSEVGERLLAIMTEIKKLPASRQPLENPHIIELFRELGFLLPEHATLALEGGLLESLVHIINGSNLSWSRYAMSNIIAIVSTMGTSCHARLINAGAPQALLEAACILIDSESRPWPQTSVEPLFVVSIALSAVILMSGSDKTSSMKETLRGLQALTRLLVIARHNMKSCPPVAALALTAALPLITMQDGQMADELLGISVDILAGIENWRVIVHYNTEDRTRSQELERFLSPEATRNGLILALAIYAENGSWACRQVASPPLLNAIARIIRFRTSPNTTESLYRAVDILHSIASDDADPNFVRSFLQANIPSVLVDLLASGPSRAPLELDDGRRLPSIIPKIMGTLSNLCDTGIPAQEAIAAEDDTGLNVMLSILRSPKFNSREHFMALHILFSFVAQVDSPDRRCGHRLARAGCIEVFKDILEREDASPTVRAMTVKATYRCMAATQTENTVIRRFIESGIVPLVIGHIRNPDSVHQLLAAGAGCVGEFARCGELGIRSVLDANAFDALALVLNRRDTDPDARRCALLGIRMTSNLNAKLFIACASSEVVPALQKHLAEPRLYDGCGPNHIPIAKELLQQLLTARRLLQRHGPGFVAAVMHKLKEAAR